VTSQRVLRIAAGVAVLALLIGVAVVLIPPYVANWKLQRYVNELIEDPTIVKESPDAVRNKVRERAAALGLPLRNEDVQVMPSGNALRIDALYVVHVDVAGYTVDLHFRPAAGGT